MVINKKAFYSERGIQFLEIKEHVCLIPRTEIVKAVTEVFNFDFCFLGYDAFRVFPEGKRQPISDCCASYSESNRITLKDVLDGIASDPDEVTHYELVFKLSI